MARGVLTTLPRAMMGFFILSVHPAKEPSLYPEFCYRGLKEWIQLSRPMQSNHGFFNSSSWIVESSYCFPAVSYSCEQGFTEKGVRGQISLRDTASYMLLIWLAIALFQTTQTLVACCIPETLCINCTSTKGILT